MYFDAKLLSIGSWRAGYRPTKVRVTVEGATPSILTIKDVVGGSILQYLDYDSGLAVDIPAFVNDIRTLEIDGDGDDHFYITNIEFYPGP